MNKIKSTGKKKKKYWQRNDDNKKKPNKFCYWKIQFLKWKVFHWASTADNQQAEKRISELLNRIIKVTGSEAEHRGKRLKKTKELVKYYQRINESIIGVPKGEEKKERK